MILADDPIHRAGWIARATFTTNTIEDLRRELSVAIRQKPPIHIMAKLAEADVHLAVSQGELRDAIARLDMIQQPP